MLTPQQIEEFSFEKALFGGYDMGFVDDFRQKVAEDYASLYKENTTLKGKLRILVEKLEEYRRQEGSLQNALIEAQKTREQMLAATEKKCAAMLQEAQNTVAAKTRNLDAQVDAEKERLAAARQATDKFILGMEKRLARQLELLAELRKIELPEQPQAFDYEASAPAAEEQLDSIIEETAQNVSEDEAVAEEVSKEKPAKSEFHGALDPAKQRILEELQFGRAIEPEKHEE